MLYMDMIVYLFCRYHVVSKVLRSWLGLLLLLLAELLR